jgi:hypothetical protein
LLIGKLVDAGLAKLGVIIILSGGRIIGNCGNVFLLAFDAF